MRKYLSNSIMVLGSLVLVFAMFYVFSARSLAGNPTNAASTGNVTGIVICEDDEDDDLHLGPTRIAIDSDGCTCELPDPTEGPLECDEDESCPACLVSLQRAGMTVTQANGFAPGNPEDEDQSVFHYLLTGNAGPFITRLGGCPCNDGL